MEKRFNLKVSVRIGEKCKNVIDQVSYNHLILCGRDQSEHKKFQFEKIYSPNDNNEKLFESMLRGPSNLLLEGFSSMLFFLGCPNSGKTYSLAGKTSKKSEEEEENPGIMIYMMRRLFSKFKHEMSLYSTYSFWCRFLYIEKDKVRSTEDIVTEENWLGNGTRIEIKSYSHFEELISLVYSKNSNKSHTIIELILQKETPNQEPVTSSVTFIELGSFFYNCPFREAEELLMENDIEATLMVIKSLTKNKNSPQHPNLFDVCLLTKVLKTNFLRSTSYEFVGVLDDSYENNLKTFNFLELISQKKVNHASSRNAKEEIKREELLLKGLYEKHRKILNLLSKCIGMELGYLDKNNKKRNFDGPILNTFYKTCEKMKFANQKKLNNEKLLEELHKNYEKENQESESINKEYEIKYKMLEEQKKTLNKQKYELNKIYENIINPNIKFSNFDHSLYYKVENNDIKEFKKFNIDDDVPSIMDTDRESKNERDFKSYPSTSQMPTRRNIPKMDSHFFKDRQNEKYEKEMERETTVLAERRVREMKLEMRKLFELMISQESQIDKLTTALPLHWTNLHNKIKNRTSEMDYNIQEIKNCLEKHCKTSKDNIFYSEMLENMKIHKKIEKEIANNAVSINAISMKSLKSEKHIHKNI